MMKIAITGAGGFIGSRLRQRFPEHIVLNRDEAGQALVRKLEGCSAVVNLAGAPIIKRWSSVYKKVLWDSRIGTTKRLVSALNSLDRPIHLVSASAIGIYPDGTPCDESCSKRAEGFLAELASAWEEAAHEYRGATAVIRIGMVLGPEGGALKMMLPVFRMGLGGRIGDGSMIMSWIDIEDLIRAVSFILEGGKSGIFNMVSPNPVSNAEFTRALSEVLGRPALLPVPVFMLKLVYGEAAQVLTASKEVYPRALQEAGFRFRYPELRASLRHLLG